MRKYLIILISSFILISIFILKSESQNWSSLSHFTGDDFRILEIVNDESGNVYISGRFRGVYSSYTSRNSGFDLFIAKINSTGSVLWFKQIGSDAIDFFPKIAYKDNVIYFLGSCQGTTYISNTDTITLSAASRDLLFIKYSTEGSLLLKQRLAYGTSHINPSSIDVDISNRLIISGAYVNGINIGSYNFTGGTNNFITKVGLNGNVIRAIDIRGTSSTSRIWDGKSFDDGYYFTGYFANQLTLDVKELNSSGSNDVFIYKTDTALTGLWTRQAYGSGSDACGSVTSDLYGNVYYNGYFQSPSLTIDSTLSALSTQTITNIGNADIFIFKYNKNGILQWARNYGSATREYAIEIYEKNDFLYTSGYYTNQLLFGPDTLQAFNLNDTNIFIGTFDLLGNMIKGDDITGSTQGEDISEALYVDNNNNVFVSGYFRSPILNVGLQQLTNSNPSNYDGLIARYSPPYSAVFTTVRNLSCNNSNDGYLKVTPYFGVPPYTYTWSHAPNPAINDSVAANLPAGTYSVTVTDSRDSSDIATITLTQPQTLSPSGIITHVTCYNGSDGAINLSVAGGTTPYQYAWNSPDGSGINPDSMDQTGINRGTYYVTITDNNLCQAMDTFVVSQPNKILFAGSSVDTIKIPPGDNGAINLNVNGGTPAYAYNWIGPQGIIVNPSDTLDSLSLGGNYIVQVTDSKGCTRDTSFLVVSDTMFIAYISAHIDVDCNGNSTGSATVSVINGSADLTYEWTRLGIPVGTTQTLSGVPAGTYNIKVTDNGSSKVSNASVIITEPPSPLKVNSIIGTDLRCYWDNSGVVNLSVSGGTLPFSYDWNTGQTTEDLVNVPALNYSVTITDANGCQQDTGVIIDQPNDPISVDITINQEILCHGELAAVVTADGDGGTGQLSYLWDDPGAQDTKTATALGAGIYMVKVTDINQCFITDQVIITQPSEIEVSSAITSPNCFGESTGQIIPIVSAGTGTAPFDYVWSTGLVGRIISNIPADGYVLTITDNNNCVDSFIYTLTDPQPLIITNIDTTEPLCYGYSTGTIAITAEGGTGSYTYSLNGGTYQASSLFSLLPAGDYTVSVMDANLCPSPDSLITLDQPERITFVSQLAESVTCRDNADGSITITLSDGTGFTYSINDGLNYYDNNGQFTGLSGGDYPVRVTDGICEFAGDTLAIIEPQQITVNSQTVEDISCAGSNDGRIEINASGGTGTLQYSIDGGLNYATSGIFSDLSQGNYTILITDDNDCDSTLSPLTILEPDTLKIDTLEVIQITGDTEGSVTLGHTGGTIPLIYVSVPVLSDSLTNNDGIFTDLEADSYTFYALDNHLCRSNSISITLIEIIGSELIIYDAFSPNGDAVNDLWNIANIQRFPYCTVKIYNSWGNQVFDSEGYTEPWNGKYHGNELPSGTYYYVIDLGDGSKTLTGPVSIVK